LLSFSGRCCGVALSPEVAPRKAARNALRAILDCSLRKKRDPPTIKVARKMPTANMMGGALVERFWR
jgi:hypothetical protein